MDLLFPSWGNNHTGHSPFVLPDSILQVSLRPIEQRIRDERDGRAEHQPGEKPEILRTVHPRLAAGIRGARKTRGVGFLRGFRLDAEFVFAPCQPWLGGMEFVGP